MRPLSACALTESFKLAFDDRADAADVGVAVAAVAGELVDSRRAASLPRQASEASETRAKTLINAAMSVFE